MRIERMELGTMQVNCYIVWDPEIKKAYVIDPGDCADKIYEWLNEQGLSCGAILLTHGHFDHITGVNELKKLTGAEIYAGRKEAVLLADDDLNVSKRVRRPVTVTPDRLLDDGEVVEGFGMSFRTLFTAGHTKGSVCFYFEKDAAVFCGDTLFRRGIGRTDLPTGNEEELYYSITHKLLSLPGNTVCYPGHGEATDIASESKYFRA
jgi:glyoxylase-like metal-dependent hydrolase (beta-lactamase superfamily II)